MTVAPPMCVGCKHLSTKRTGPLACTAYPSGIPDEIIRSIVDHRQPHAGDHGIVFEPKTPADAERAERRFPTASPSATP